VAVHNVDENLAPVLLRAMHTCFMSHLSVLVLILVLLQLVLTRTLQFAVCHSATGTHVPYRITQRYLPPGRGNIPASTPAGAGTRLSDPGWMQG